MPVAIHSPVPHNKSTLIDLLNASRESVVIGNIQNMGGLKIDWNYSCRFRPALSLNQWYQRQMGHKREEIAEYKKFYMSHTFCPLTVVVSRRRNRIEPI